MSIEIRIERAEYRNIGANMRPMDSNHNSDIG